MNCKSIITQKPKKKRKNLEYLLQCQCVDWFRMQYPKKTIFAIPNGGSRHIAEAVKLKKMGVLRGVPDLFIPHPKRGYSGFFIEMKVGKGKTSDEQNKMIGVFLLNGYAVEVINTFEDFCHKVNIYFRY